MKNQAKYLFLVFILFSTVSAISAKSVYEVASTALVAKLQEDLADSRIQLKISKAKTYEFSKSLIGVKGEGTTEGLKINFDIKLSKGNLIPKSIDYNILESEMISASFEDKLNRQLLNKINKDLKTTNITIAVDGFDTTENSLNEAVTTGQGEVSINSEWRKIKFEVVENKTNNKVTKITYQLD